MEDVLLTHKTAPDGLFALGVYERPFNPKRPMVCVDEGKKGLRSTPRGSIPAKPGREKREDYEYAREGSANIFMALEPLAGKRVVKITGEIEAKIMLLDHKMHLTGMVASGVQRTTQRCSTLDAFTAEKSGCR